jgi:hypothetical protein
MAGLKAQRVRQRRTDVEESHPCGPHGNPPPGSIRRTSIPRSTSRPADAGAASHIFLEVHSILETADPDKGIMKTVLVALALVSSATSALGQTHPSKIPVSVFSESKDDNIGSQIVLELKEAIRSSERFSLIDGKPFDRRHQRFKEDSLGFLAMYVATLADGDSRSFYSVAFTYNSLTVPLNGGFVDHLVGVCGKQVIADCARSLLSDLDRATDAIQEATPGFYKNLLSD